MGVVNDALFGLEGDLERNADSPLGRRFVLRKALRKAYDDGWKQGHADGVRDYSETLVQADQQAQEDGDG